MPWCRQATCQWLNQCCPRCTTQNVVTRRYMTPQSINCRYETRNALQRRHNGRYGVSNHWHHDCLLNRLFSRRSKKTSTLRVTGLCSGNSPVTGEFPTQMASNAENVSIWWRHHASNIQNYFFIYKIWHEVASSTAKHRPWLNPMGKLWGVFCEYVWEIWYKTQLHIFFGGKTVKCYGGTIVKLHSDYMVKP